MTPRAFLNTGLGQSGGAGAGRGGSFLIQTNIRRADRTTPSDQNEPLENPDAADAGIGGPSFGTVLQAASRGADSNDPIRAGSLRETESKAPSRDARKVRQHGDSDDSTTQTHTGQGSAAGDADASAQKPPEDPSNPGDGDADKKKQTAADASSGKKQESSDPPAQDATASALVTPANQATRAPTAPAPQGGAAGGTGSDQPAALPTQGVPAVPLQGAEQPGAGHQTAKIPDKAEKADDSAAPGAQADESKALAKPQFPGVEKGSVSALAPGPGAPAEKGAPAKGNPPALPVKDPAATATLAKATVMQQQNANGTATQNSQAQAASGNTGATVGAGSAPSRLISAVAKETGSEKGHAAPTADPPLAAAISVQQAAGNHAEVAPAAQESPAMNAQETYDQIVLGLKGQMDPKAGKAQIMLDPPNLGAVKVSLSLANGVLTAQFESSTGAVRDLLKSNLDKLKTVLQGQGIAVDKLAVDAPVAAKDAGATGGQMQQNAFGSGAHNGRSAGGFGQEARSGQERWHPSNGANGFAQMFAGAQDAPIDLVA